MKPPWRVARGEACRERRAGREWFEANRGGNGLQRQRSAPGRILPLPQAKFLLDIPNPVTLKVPFPLFLHLCSTQPDDFKQPCRWLAEREAAAASPEPQGELRSEMSRSWADRKQLHESLPPIHSNKQGTHTVRNPWDSFKKHPGTWNSGALHHDTVLQPSGHIYTLC